MAATRKFRIWRGDANGGAFREYDVEVGPGMVVLDAIHRIQATQATDLAVRWNCKAGKCGSCSCEINGRPKLSCMTRITDYADGETITVQPMKTFPVLKDLVCDVSWNFERNKTIKPFKPRPPDADGQYRMQQCDVERVQEFRKCIECFLCQDVCHVVRDRGRKDAFAGPRFMIRIASLEMHPLDTEDRVPDARKVHGVGMCNITRCCTEVCPEHINITDNGIIPMKERVVDRYFDPVAIAARKIFGGEVTGRVDRAFVVHEADHWIVNHRMDAALPGYLMIGARDESVHTLSEASEEALVELGPLLAKVSGAVESVLDAERVHVGRYGHASGWPVHFHVIPVYGWLVEAFDGDSSYDGVRRLNGPGSASGPDGAELTLYVWREWTTAEGRVPSVAPGPTVAEAIVALRTRLARR